jgi:hypothetical protein
MGDKHCPRCGEAKPHSDFYANAGWRDGLHPYCKPCLLAYQRSARQAKLDATNPHRRKWTKWSLKHDYFHNIDDPLKAYLLGLLAADGNVLDSTPRITLELATKDVELVELLRDAIAPGVPLRYRNPRGNGARHATLAVTSAEMVADLARFGIVPRKTSTLRWPVEVPVAMQRPYLLGHFDGDGFVTIAHRYRGRASGRWGLLGTRALLEGAIDLIAREVDVRPRNIRAKPGVHYVNIDGPDALKVDEWLHNGMPFGLERKRLSRMLAA